MNGLIAVAAYPDMPKGLCVVRFEGRVLYAGSLREAGPYLQDGAMLCLSPEDFADGNAYMKKLLN